jgi:hypothetical protein
MSNRRTSMDDDIAFVARLRQGDEGAAADLFRRVKDTIWTACKLGTRDENAAHLAYAIVSEGLQADGFSRLQPFRGGRLESFVALVARELLLDHILRLPATNRVWLTFEALFKRAIMAMIVKLPATAAEPEDIYQRVSIKLAAHDYTLLRRYCAHGTLGLSLRKIVSSARIDSIREKMGRREIPEAVKTLCALDQLVFMQVYWKREPPDPDLPDRLLSVLRATTKTPFLNRLTREKIEAALSRVQAAVPPGYVVPEFVPIDDNEPGESGEDKVIREMLTAYVVDELHAAIEKLPDHLRLFVRDLLEPPKDGEERHGKLRRLYGEERYDKQYRQAKTELLRLLRDDPAFKEWIDLKDEEDRKAGPRPRAGDGNPTPRDVGGHE